MKNAKEQAFCTKLGAWLKKTKHPQSMLIECKVVEGNDDFDFKQIRKSQVGTLNRLMEGLPIVYKIADAAIGSKLVDMIYVSPTPTELQGFVAIYYTETKAAYLVPWLQVLAPSFYSNKIKEVHFFQYRVW